MAWYNRITVQLRILYLLIFIYIIVTIVIMHYCDYLGWLFYVLVKVLVKSLMPGSISDVPQ